MGDSAHFLVGFSKPGGGGRRGEGKSLRGRRQGPVRSPHEEGGGKSTTRGRFHRPTDPLAFG